MLQANETRYIAELANKRKPEKELDALTHLINRKANEGFFEVTVYIRLEYLNFILDKLKVSGYQTKHQPFKKCEVTISW